MALSMYMVIQNDCLGYNCSAAIPHQIQETTTILQFHPKVVCTVSRNRVCVCIPELKVRIRTAIETITADMLQTVWNELDYRVDVCKIT